MKTITIPTFMSPYKCTINGVTYTYPAGTEQTVPDEVAALIEANAAATNYGKRANSGNVDPMAESGLFPGKIVPPFADATPEQIAWIAQNDDPSKYWTAGDFRVKKIPSSNPTATIGTDGTNRVTDIRNFLKISEITKNGNYSYIFQEGGGAEDRVSIKDESGKYISNHSSGDYDGLVEDCGISFDFTVSEYSTEADIYLSIAGFNHDYVVNKKTYGKQKAGLSLMVGASRERTENDRVGVFLPKIPGMVDSYGYYKRSNEGTKNYESNAAYRSYLQKVLDYFPEFAEFVQPVIKYTAQYYKHTNRYTGWLVTYDKVFIPSEYECFGEVVLSPNKEGEQYELFKNGESKIIVTPELAAAYNGGSSTAYSRLWLRSTVAQYVNTHLPPVGNTYTPLNSLTANPSRVGDNCDYNNSIIMSYNPTSRQYNYSPSSAHSNSSSYPPYILPMFCL